MQRMTVKCSFWTDSKIRKMSAPAKYLALYLVTNPHVHWSGLYYLPRDLIHTELSLPQGHVDKAFSELEKARFAFYDRPTETVFVRRMLVHQEHFGPKIKKHLAEHVSEVDSPYLKEFRKEYRLWEIPYLGVVEGSPKSSPRPQPVENPVDREAFERIWKKYPKRAGANPKTPAYEAFRARITEGVSIAALEAAVDRYAKFCEATGKIGTETVQQAESFFGPRKRGFEESWEIPAKNGKRLIGYRAPDGSLIPKNARIQWFEETHGAFTRQIDNGTWHVVREQIQEVWE